jgi:hypothetical protein
MEDLRVMVWRSTLIVRAKVISIGRLEREGDEDYPIETATVAVEKVLFGSCDRIIHIYDHVATGYGEQAEVGGVYYLCLYRLSTRPGYHNEINAGLSKMQLKDDGRVHVDKLIIPDSLKTVLTNPTQETLEGVIRWLRGPTVSATPVKQAFQCDEPIEFDVTLTNDSPLLMKLEMGSDAHALSRLIGAALWDEKGFPILGELGNCFVPPPVAHADGKVKQIVRTLRPGESLEGRLRYRVLLSDCIQDPARTRSLSLTIITGEYMEEDIPPADVWRGYTRVDAPLRLTCPHERWTATLSRPAGPLRVQIGGQDESDWRPIRAHAGQPVRVTIACAPPKRESRYFDWDYSTLAIVAPKAKRPLAACWKVTRGGKALTGQKATREEIAAWLESVRESDDDNGHTFDLAKHFPLKEPGTYRVRLALPFAEGDSLSNVLTVQVVDAPAR